MRYLLLAALIFSGCGVTALPVDDMGLPAPDLAELGDANAGDLEPLDFALPPDLAPPDLAPRSFAFDYAPTVAVGKGPQHAIAADFDGDGKADVAALAFTDSVVSMLLGNGDGTFKPAANQGTGLHPVALVAADFNGDGKPDIATEDSTGVSVLINNGNATFKPPVTYATGNALGELLSQDLNGDGHPDLLASANDSSNGVNVAVLLGKADGTFEPVVHNAIAVNGSSGAFALGDLNGDTRVDILTLNVSYASPNYTYTWMYALGNANGTFGPITASASTFTLPFDQGGSFILPTRLADLNGDQHADVIVLVPDKMIPLGGTLAYQPQRLAVVLGNGDTTFQTPVFTPIDPAGPAAVEMRDVDGDGKIDAVYGVNTRLLSASSLCGALAILKGNGDGTLQGATAYVLGDGIAGFERAYADFNGDGRLDIVVPNQAENTVSVMLARGDGSFRAGRHVGTLGPSTAGVAIADFDKDGQLDIATALSNDTLPAQNRVAVSLGGANHTFARSQTFAVGTNPSALASGDVNGDTKSDLVVTNLGGNVSILLGNGDGSFQAASPFFAGSMPNALVLADLNHDNNLDIVTLSKATIPSASVLLGNGNGTFGGAVSAGTIHGGYGLVAADLNGDNNVDVTTGAGFALGKGDGTFQTATQITSSMTPLSVAIGDVNGDGKQDVLWTDQSYGLLTAIGDGAGNFTPSYISLQGALPMGAVGIGDFNGDGIADIVLAVSPNGSPHPILQILPGIGGGAYGPAVFTTGVATYRSALVVDVDKDGKPDIVVSSDSGVDVFYNTAP